jgi:hypothetical protein
MAPFHFSVSSCSTRASKKTRDLRLHELVQAKGDGGSAGPYFGITSRASLLATTVRISLRFLPASIMASREP